MSYQLRDSLANNANYSDRITVLEKKLTQVSGLLEELEYKQKSQLKIQNQTWEEKFIALEETSRESYQNIEILKKDLTEQSLYIKKVLSELKSMKTPKKQNSYATAMLHYKKGRYKKARELLLRLEKKSTIRGNRRARLLHNLGLIGYMTKKYDQGLKYLSTLFTEFPKSNYNKNGLLILGKSLRASSKQEESKLIFAELIKRFPKSKQAKIAGQILREI